MNTPEFGHRGKIAVLYEGDGEIELFQQLAKRLSVPLRIRDEAEDGHLESLFLGWRKGCLTLIDHSNQKKGGLSVQFEISGTEQRSWPAAKKGLLAKAIGRKTDTVIDATTGWGQDSFFIFRMGYQLRCIERSQVMAELLRDGLRRLAGQEWMQHLGINPPQLLVGNAIEILGEIETRPDCIYLDPMYPPKRKKSALARKSMLILRDLLGDDLDREELFAVALKAAGKRVVVKSPDYAEPLGGKAHASFQGKLVRYDVYFK